MSNFTLPDFEIGMVVVTPSKDVPLLTEDKYYIIEDITEDHLGVRNDSDDLKYYSSHIFIEANVYYNMILWLSMLRLFEINPKSL